MDKFAFFVLCTISLLAEVHWSAPITLSEETQDSNAPVAAVSYSTGEVAIAWEISDGSNQVIQAAFFDGSSWSNPVNLSDPSFHSEQVSIGINNSGHAIALWRRILSATTSVIETSFFDGSSWSNPVAISSSTFPDNPVLSMHPTQDRAIALWRASSGLSDLESAFFDGMDWNAINGFSPEADRLELSLSLNDQDRAAASWISPKDQKAAWISFYDSSWSMPIAISNADTPPIQINVCMDVSTDRAAIVWSTLTALDAAIWNGSGWESIESLIPAATFVLEPNVFFHPTDHSNAAVWRGSLGVQGAIYENLNWTNPLTFTGQGLTPKGAFNPIDGKVGVVWTTTTALQFTEFDAMTFSQPINLTTSTLIESPSILIDYEGNSFAIWSAALGMHQVIQVAMGTSD